MLEHLLNAALRRSVEAAVTQPLRDAIQYALFPGGKRIRPALCFLVLKYLGRNPKDADYLAAAALELIHVSSLVHDDLPALDNDDVRRGKPTVHRAFGEATAVLCGDALIACAFETLAGLSTSADKRLALTRSLSGAFRLICEGQQADLLVSRSSAERLAVDRMKTAALFRCSAEFGAILAGASEASVAAAGNFGEELGLLFQKVDDKDDGELSSEDELVLATRRVREALSLLEQTAGQGSSTEIAALVSRVAGPNLHAS